MIFTPARHDSKGRVAVARKEKKRGRKGELLEEGIIYRPKPDNYAYNYIDPNGDRQWFYSKDLEVVRAERLKVIKAGNDDLDYYAKGKASVNVLLRMYLNSKPDLKASTNDGYWYTFQKYIEPGFGKKKIKDIHYSHVKDFYIYLLYERKTGISIVDSVNNILNPAFKMAVRDRIIPSNPVEGVLTEVKKAGKFKLEVRHPLTVEEQMIFMEDLEKPENRMWKPVFMVFLGTGCRPGEIFGLRYEDIDMENRIITIDHELFYGMLRDNTTGKRKNGYLLTTPKTEAGDRTIPMTDKVYEAFLDQKKLSEDTGTFCSQSVNGYSGFIFFNKNGGCMNQSILNRKLHWIQDRYNHAEVLKAKRASRNPVLLPEFSLYTLRHTFCSRLCENSTNIKFIQTMMGHKQIETTLNVYAEITSEAQKGLVKEFSEKMESIFEKRRDAEKDGDSLEE